MSATSDRYEREVANYINKIPSVKATRPTVGADYPDVLVEYNRKKAFLEVKMNHKDNLSNPRVFYRNNKWQTTYSTPAATLAVEILNRSQQTKMFLKGISAFSGIPLNIIKIPTTISGLREEGAVPLHVMKAYFDRPQINRYIANQENINLGKVVTEHYTKGKTQPAFYMQAGDDFYKISNKDPFNLGNDIPLLSGNGDFKVRVATRSEFYEVQAEIKIDRMPNSPYSVKPGTTKQNPFLK